MKLHYKVVNTSEQPCYMSDEDWNNQTICGYVRNKTTTDKSKVTCFYCKSKLTK